ncbi:MAG: hypothetical protein RR036_04655 [Oscillospiraceae bacterium]
MKKKITKLELTKKAVLNYGFFAVVSFVLLLSLTLGWFSMNKSVTASGLAVRSLSHDLSATIKLKKNGSDTINDKNIFTGLVPGDIFTFTITVNRTSTEPLTLAVSAENIKSTPPTITPPPTPPTVSEISKMFSMQYEKEAVINLFDTVKFPIKTGIAMPVNTLTIAFDITMTFNDNVSGTTANDVFQHSLNFDGFFIEVVG